jgi:hypothetical protein
MNKEYLSFIDNTEQILEIYQTVISKKYTFEDQKRLYIVFHEYKDKSKSHTSILEIIEQAQMLSGLRKSLHEIIIIYNSNSILFENTDTYSLCHQEAELKKREHEIQHEKVAALKIEKIRNSNYADSAWYGGNKVEYERYMQNDKRLEIEIENASIEENKYSQLYNDKYKDVMQYRENVFHEVAELAVSYLIILNNYLPIEKGKKPVEAKPALKQGAYFGMKLVSLIHNECNNIQFENLPEIDLYSILNLQPTNAKLTIKTGERTRMCYLIYKLYEYLKTENRTEWRIAILESAGIEKKYYDSKYKEPISEIPSRRSEKFAQLIDGIFKNLS